MNKKVALFLKPWPIYIFAIALTSFVVSMGISLKCKPTEREKIMVFAASGTIKVGDFVSESKSVTDDSIREIEVRHGYCNEDQTSIVFGQVYAYCDFYIFPESWVERIKPIALTFSESNIHEQIPNSASLPLLKDGEDNIGLKIYDKDSKVGVMKSLITYVEEKEEDYYIIFRNSSLHLSELNNSSSDNALKMVNKLLTL